jgi:hypothetical protein
VVCLDETSKQLVAETRVPVPMKPGQPARSDYEYERNGTANMFMMFAPLEGWRHVKVTDRHTAVDYAHTHFPDARTIILVQDNLNTPKPASLYEAFSAAARGSSNGSNAITLQSMAVGSIWPSPNSASFRPNASIAASQTTIMPDEKAVSAVTFFKAAVAYYAGFGVNVARMTDNGPAYKSFAFAFARACRRLKIKHLRTKP